jgi:hypothetical protein
MRLANCLILVVTAVAACSKSPTAVVADPAGTVGQRLMQPLVQKDASIQAKRMTELLSDKPACEIFKERMKEAGKGSPYEGTTQWRLVHAQQDACAAGCCN